MLAELIEIYGLSRAELLAQLGDIDESDEAIDARLKSEFSEPDRAVLRTTHDNPFVVIGGCPRDPIDWIAPDASDGCAA